MELIKPMEPILSHKIIQDSNYTHQIKWDGIRGITYINNNDYKVFTKNGNERTDFYPEIKDIINLLKCKRGIIDGEIIVLDDNLRPSFNYILNRERVRDYKKIKYYAKKYPIKYVVFDILYMDDKDLRDIPLENRNEILKEKLNRNSNITITDSFDDGALLFDLMKKKNFEGIVSKNIYSKYIAGKKHNMWYKTKIYKKMLVVIGGILFSNDVIKSMLIGIYCNEQLLYIGNVSLGLKQSDLELLKKNLQLMSTEYSAFSNIKVAKNVIWLRPILTCWVSFLEWTNEFSLRHPKIIGFSSKKPIEANGEEYTLNG